jgi:hypothetical protein
MFLTRTFTHRRTSMLAAAGALLLATLFVTPQGQAFASSLLNLFKGTSIQGVSTDVSHLKNFYSTFEELEKLGSVQGSAPSTLNSVASISAAQNLTHFSLAQPATFPNGVNHTPSQVRAVGASEVVITFDKAKADAYFKSIGKGNTLPSNFDKAQLIIDFPAVSLLEYNGSAHLFVGQAGQLVVNVAGGSNLTVDEVRNYLLTLPTLSPDTANVLKGISNWQNTIPLGIPTDKARWSNTSVGGSLSGSGVLLNDNSGIGSAVVWQHAQTQSLGVAGYGLTANQVQSVANSLH